MNEGRSMLPEELCRITIPQWIALGGKKKAAGQGRVRSAAELAKVVRDMERMHTPDGLLEQGEKQLQRYRERAGMD